MPHFQPGWPAAFTQSFLEARAVKAHSEKPYTLKDTHEFQRDGFSSAHAVCSDG